MLIQNPLNTFKIPWFSRNFLGTCRYFLIKVIRNLFEPKYKRIELKWLVHEFHDLTFENQMSKLEFYCEEFGLYTSDQEASDFGKVSEPSLSEVQEFNLLHFWG